MKVQRVGYPRGLPYETIVKASKQACNPFRKLGERNSHVTTYEFRPSIRQKEVRYGLNGRGLALPDGNSLDFADIKLVRVYKLRGGLLSGSKRCVIQPTHGRPIVLISFHFVSLGNFEDRSEQFQRFVDTLIHQVAAANPKTIFVAGFPMILWWLWATVLACAAIAMPLAVGVFFILMLRDSTIVTLVVVAPTLAAIAFCLFYFLRSLGPDWPRRFDPR
jgi:hypothetical protein